MENEKRIMDKESVNKNRVSEEFKLQIKQMPYYQIIQNNIENPSDHVYAVVTPVDNMEMFQKKYC